MPIAELIHPTHPFHPSTMSGHPDTNGPTPAAQDPEQSSSSPSSRSGGPPAASTAPSTDEARVASTAAPLKHAIAAGQAGHNQQAGSVTHQDQAFAAHTAAVQARSQASAGVAAATAPIMGSNNPAMGAPPTKISPVARAPSATVDNGMLKLPPNKPRYKKRTKKYNNFNIFFMLERQLLLQSRGGGINAIENPINTKNQPLVKYKELRLPKLPRRYSHLPLTENWFLELLANQNKKRPHRKSHGLIPFKELAQTVAKNYREIDDETQEFVNEVAERLGWHMEEVEALEEKERREYEAKYGALPQPKKRKDAPVVNVGTAASHKGIKSALSTDEAATIQQLVGMKTTNSPPAPSAGYPHGYPGAMPPGFPAHNMGYGAYPTVPSSHHVPTQPPHHPFYPPPHRAAAYPMAAHSSSTAAAGTNHGGGGNESDRLKLELAQAMNARRESEQRIQLLKEQMNIQNAKQQAEGPDRSSLPPGSYEHYLSMAKASYQGGSPSLPSSRYPAAPAPGPTASDTRSPGDMASIEKDLLREALIRRLVPPSAVADAMAARDRDSNPPSDALLSSYLNRGISPPSRMSHHEAAIAAEAAQLAKRRRYSEEDIEELLKKRVATSSARPPSNAGDIDFYNDLYSKMAGSRLPPPPPSQRNDHHPSSAPATTRELVYLDSLAARAPSGAAAAASSRLGASADALLMEKLARGSGGAHHMHPPAPSRDDHSYSAYLSRMSAAGHPMPAPGSSPSHAAAGAPPPAGSNNGAKQELMEMVKAASKKSQFGLSYNDIMDVWKEMNKDNEGEGKKEGGN